MNDKICSQSYECVVFLVLISRVCEPLEVLVTAGVGTETREAGKLQVQPNLPNCTKKSFFYHEKEIALNITL